MKYRSDFVTNSSSSSFLISVKNEAVYEPIIHALVVSSGDYDTHEGTLCKTIEDVEEYIPIDVSLLGYGEYFGLIARGDSMIDAGIHDGDTVYIRKQNSAMDGEIVVAMVEDDFDDGWSATLKRFYRDLKNNRYILHPENSRLEDIIVDQVHVVGVAVRVLKNLETKRRYC